MNTTYYFKLEFPLSYLVQTPAKLKYIEDLVQIHQIFGGLVQKNNFKILKTLMVFLTNMRALTTLFPFLTLLAKYS